LHSWAVASGLLASIHATIAAKADHADGRRTLIILSSLGAGEPRSDFSDDTRRRGAGQRDMGARNWNFHIE
jgi:hypothetical protein